MKFAMNRFRELAACLFVNDKKWPWHFTVVWLIFTLWYGWLFSPVIVYFAIGVPALQDLQVLKGEPSIEGAVKTYSNTRKPPDYYIETPQGKVRVHCGPLPHPRGCYGLSYACFPPTRGTTVWYDSYFGILQLECVERSGKKTWFPYDDTIDVDVRREIGRDGKGAAIVFPLLILLYAYQVRRTYRNALTTDGKGK